MSTAGVHRKLAAILCADVEGYSRLMQDDPEGTLHTLKDHREIFRRYTEHHDGRVVDSPGDNILIEFASAIEAVQCAVEIQRELGEKNAELADNRRMRFRIGIDLGDLLEQDDALYGDGVNISARLQSLAESGGICVSGRAYDQVVNRLPLKFEFLGKRSVKNIAHSIRVYRVLTKSGDAMNGAVRFKPRDPWKLPKVATSIAAALIIIVGAGLIWQHYFRSLPGRRSIAVLPFENLSSDPEQVYFVDGLSEEILNRLAQIPDLLVTARTSSFSFKDTKKTVQEIANVLGVEYILEGSVRKAGNALRITAQLVRATDSTHLWSKTYDRELKDIFAVQEDIAVTVANELKATFGIGEPHRKLGGTDNVDAYELYLNALGHQHEASYDVYIRGLESLDAAISLDPEFANAWAQKAFFHTHLLLWEPAERSTFEQNEALRAARKAIELEPNLAAGHFQMGWVKTLTGDWIEAEQAYRRALERTTDPFSYEVAPYPLHYFALGYFEKSEDLIEKFLQKNSYHQAMRAFYMLNLYILGDTQGAEKEFQRSMAMFNDDWFWGIAFSTLARLGTDKVVFPEINSDIPISDQIWSLGREYFKLPKEGLEAVRHVYDSNDNLVTWDFMQIALFTAYFGNPEFAMEAMEKELRISAVDFICAWLPVMHEVRQLPRFKEFVKEMGLVDYWNQFGWPDICQPTDDGDLVCD